MVDIKVSRKLIPFFLIFTSVSLHSQILHEIEGSITVEGKSFNLGDTIIMYEPTNYGDNYVSIYKDKKLLKSFPALEGESNDQINWTMTSLIPNKIYKNEEGKILLAKKSVLLNVYVDFEKALQAGEIITKEMKNRFPLLIGF